MGKRVSEETLVTMDPSGAPGSAPAAPDPTAALTDVRNQLMRLGQQIAEMRTEPGTAQAEAANGVIAELREAVRFLAERLDGVARMVAQRGEELADTRGALSAIDAHVRSQAETIGMLTTGMQALPSYGERVSALQDNINGLQQRLTGIEGSFGPIGQRLGSIETAVSRPDSAVSERLAALEGMIGPMSQRLGQSLTEHNASLQALHGRVEALATGTQASFESLASGTQAALATPVSVDDGAVAAIEPRLASLVSDLAALRSEVSALAAASPTAALAELKDEIAKLAVAKPVGKGSGSARAVASADVDAAVAAAESRIKDHVDDAIVALAQTLLGKARADAVGAVAPVDEPAAGGQGAAGSGGDESLRRANGVRRCRLRRRPGWRCRRRRRRRDRPQRPGPRRPGCVADRRVEPATGCADQRRAVRRSGRAAVGGPLRPGRRLGRPRWSPWCRRR
jgi:hypothetical protein